MPILALLAALLAQNPAYTEAGLVNSASGAPNRLSPNTHVTLYGIFRPTPTPQAFLSDQPANVMFFNSGQINLVLPPGPPGPRELWILQGGWAGPRMRIQLAAFSPELYANPEGFAATTHADGRLVTPDDPLRPGSIAVVYGTGFGPTRTGEASTGRPASRADSLSTPLDLWLDGQPLPPGQILYAGVSPTFRGLYQINFILPSTTAPDPYIQIGTAGEPSSRTGVRLLLRPAPPAPPQP